MMRPCRTLVTKGHGSISIGNWGQSIRLCRIRTLAVRFPVSMNAGSRSETPLTGSAVPVMTSEFRRGMIQESQGHGKSQSLEENIEKAIYRCRFLTILGVWGSLVGSLLCFIKGCTYVVASFMEYFVSRGKVILMLFEAIDIYLIGTVMLVFGMGLYELFVSNLDIAKLVDEEKAPYQSNLFGLFTLKERPRWLEIKSVNELKTKLGHVIVMVLLVGLFEKSKKVVIRSPVDLLCFSCSILLSSACLYLLSKLND